ncbi:MAG: hypothetical protein KDJ98_20660, partial [Rhodobacteraceae bacterium]|nr:hypothetical protein [Paracoccaceae bacterium]
MLHPVVDPVAAGLDADDPHAGIIEERVEQTHRIRPATDSRDDRVGQTALAFLLFQLPAGFLADDRLEIAHHRRIGVRAGHGADAIEGIAHIGHPV